MKTAHYLLLLLLPCMIFSKGADITLTAKKIAEIKVLPTDGAETVELITRGATLHIKSSITDTLDRVWYMVKIGNTEKGGFVLASETEQLSEEIDTTNSPKLGKPASADKKRRLAIVKNNPDWPRRIKNALLAGTICLGMNRDQLSASWNLPDDEMDGFILGAGDVRILFYRKGDPVAVIIKNDEVIGWSEKKR